MFPWMPVYISMEIHAVTKKQFNSEGNDVCNSVFETNFRLAQCSTSRLFEEKEGVNENRK